MSAELLDRRAFVLANTRLQSPPLTPELRLHLADQMTPIWLMTEAVLARQGLPPPFWAFAWAGGQAIARYLLDHPHEAAGRRVADLACGGGVCAIAAARCGAAHVAAYDLEPFCAAAVEVNAQANAADVTFHAQDLLHSPPPATDLILAGDIFYERPVAERVHAWLRDAHAAGARVLMGDPGRAYFNPAGLIRLAEYDVPTSRDLEDGEVKRGEVWGFPRRSARGAGP